MGQRLVALVQLDTLMVVIQVQLSHTCLDDIMPL